MACARARTASWANLVEFRHVSHRLPLFLLPGACSSALVPARVPAANHAPPAASATPELRVFDPSLIDKCVDPCDNFYRYSCNGWFKRNPLPADQTVVWPLHRALRAESAASETDSRAGRGRLRRRARQTSRRSATSTRAAWTWPRSTRPASRRCSRSWIALRAQSTAELPALLAHLQTIGVNAFFDMGSEPGLCRCQPGDQLSMAPAAWACRSATTTRAPMRSPWSSASSMSTMCSKMFVLAGEPDAQARKDARDGAGD